MTGNRHLKIIQLSDLHLFPNRQQTLMGVNTDHYFQEVLALALSQLPDADMLLLTGDLAQLASPEVYLHLYDSLKAYNKLCVCLPGNHDDWKLMQTFLNHTMVNCIKVQCFDHWQIIALNSQIQGYPGGHIRAEELDFLSNTIKTNPNKNVFIAFHHHCLPSGSVWMDSMQIDNSHYVLQRLRKFPQIKAVTYGHIHQALDTVYADIRIFSAPATCFQFKPLSEHFAVDHLAPGYRWFELFDNGKINSGVSRLNVDMRELDENAAGY